jgi:hypothetical protein
VRKNDITTSVQGVFYYNFIRQTIPIHLVHEVSFLRDVASRRCVFVGRRRLDELSSNHPATWWHIPEERNLDYAYTIAFYKSIPSYWRQTWFYLSVKVWYYCRTDLTINSFPLPLDSRAISTCAPPHQHIFKATSFQMVLVCWVWQSVVYSFFMVFSKPYWPPLLADLITFRLRTNQKHCTVYEPRNVRPKHNYCKVYEVSWAR